MSEIDWSALQGAAATAGVLPDGDYPVIVVDATATQSSTGKAMVKAKLRVTEGPHKDNPIWTQFVVSPDSPLALRIFFQHMAAFGLDASFFAGGPSIDEVASQLRNRGAIVTIGTRMWQGQDRNEVKGISQLLSGGGPIAPGLVVGPPTTAVTSSVAGEPPVPSTPGGTQSPTTTVAAGPPIPDPF